MTNETTSDLLSLIGGSTPPTSEQFKSLVTRLDSHTVLAKVFLLEGTPFVFKNSPMKYVVFREQVADRFGVGSQDVCIVGSAKLGFSPSPNKFGTPFAESSDVDVVIISEPLFHRGSRELFGVLHGLDPAVHEIRPFTDKHKAAPSDKPVPVVALEDWKDVKEAMRNYVFQNFNPGLLPNDNSLRREIFESIGSTAGLFLALQPQVFVSKIRGRIFRTWKSAEDYYANTLREAKRAFGSKRFESDREDGFELELDRQDADAVH